MVFNNSFMLSKIIKNKKTSLTIKNYFLFFVLKNKKLDI